MFGHGARLGSGLVAVTKLIYRSHFSRFVAQDYKVLRKIAAAAVKVVDDKVVSLDSKFGTIAKEFTQFQQSHTN
jgi:hypothetical protein